MDFEEFEPTAYEAKKKVPTTKVPKTDWKTVYEANQKLLDGLDDLLAMRSTLRFSELDASSDMIASCITIVGEVTKFGERDMAEQQQIKILKQITQSRSTMIACHLDTTSMDQIVERKILVLKSRLADAAKFPFSNVIRRPSACCGSKS